MNILIFGASGATGHHLVSQALTMDHIVTAFVRDPSRLNLIKQENLKIAKGDVTDSQRVEEAISNQAVVLSALGASSPFLRDFKLIMGIENIVAGMTKQGVRRLIYQSFIGLADRSEKLGFLMQTLMPVILKSAVADHELKEAIITKSNNLDWTIVRCAKLTNGSFTGKYRTGQNIRHPSVFPLVSRADVADFMLKQVTDSKYLHKKPGIMY